MARWLNRNVMLISLSAFFADLGYQAALAILPIFLIITLKAPAYEFGLVNAIAFGGGSAFGYVGGRLSDRFSSKRIAILGNALIPLISLMGLAVSPVAAIALFSGGWWARNFRSPASRAMLVRSSSTDDRGKAFGFLHALDIGGGMVSILILLLLLLAGLGYTQILLLTAIPLVISTILLVMISDSRMARRKASRNANAALPSAGRAAYRGIILSTSLYGFSSYSLGFPILTIAQQSSSSLLGIGSYGIYLGVSAVAGYYIGSRRWNYVRTLGLYGYLLSGLGTLFLALAYLSGQGAMALYAAVAVIGFSMGVVETIEPTIVSLIKKAGSIGSGMGALTGSRSIGIFSANVIMGLLYALSPAYSYLYAGMVAILAAAIIAYSGRRFSRS